MKTLVFFAVLFSFAFVVGCNSSNEVGDSTSIDAIVADKTNSKEDISKKNINDIDEDLQAFQYPSVVLLTSQPIVVTEELINNLMLTGNKEGVTSFNNSKSSIFFGFKNSKGGDSIGGRIDETKNLSIAKSLNADIAKKEGYLEADGKKINGVDVITYRKGEALTYHFSIKNWFFVIAADDSDEELVADSLSEYFLSKYQ